jgi:hypothetical protein
MLKKEMRVGTKCATKIIARWRAKKAQGWQHGPWVGRCRKKWNQYHKMLDDSLIFFWRNPPSEIYWKPVPIETRGLMPTELGHRCLCQWQRPHLKPNFCVCNFHYIKISKNWAKIGKITALPWNWYKIRMTPKSNTNKIDGASVIQKLHIPSFCCKIHYTHARYYIVSVQWV